jgi:hypothetical protein
MGFAMQWFLIAYLSSGLSVAVTPPQKYSFMPHDKAWCEIMRDNSESRYADTPDKDLAFFCEQHRKRPKLIGKIDRDVQRSLNSICPEPSQACGMLEYDATHGLPLGTTSMRFWKRRGG